MSGRLDSILTATLVVAAIGIAGAQIHREFGKPKPPLTSAPPDSALAYVPKWQELGAVGHRIVGDSTAPVQMIEFTDFECPFCRRFHQSLEEYQKKAPGKVSVTIVHLPLTVHRFARPAARLVECSNAAGRLPEVASLIYAKQDSLGLKSWASYAAEAGVQDTVAIGRCLADKSTDRLIDAGAAAAQRLEVRATPTVILNGWRMSHAPTLDSLDRIVASLASRHQ